MWNLILKNETNELIYKTETDLQILKTNLWFTKGGNMGDKSAALDEHIHTTVYKIDNKDVPYSTGNSIFWDNLYEKRI